MQPLVVKTYSPEKTYPTHAIYVLSRGMNSGRPSFTPNRNCFVLECSPEDSQPLYWLVFALWTAKKFHPYIGGTAVPYIRIKDFAKVVNAHAAHYPRIEKIAAELMAVLELERNLRQRLALFTQLLHAVADESLRTPPESTPDQQPQNQPEL